jgi:GntR family transcriptional regulator
MADPRYRQIADGLRAKIESGDLPRDGQLPTEDDLGKEFNASRKTIRDAIKSLINLGLVETRPGQGTFVTRPPDPLVTTLSADGVARLGGGEGAAYRSEPTGPDNRARTRPRRDDVIPAAAQRPYPGLQDFRHHGRSK